MLERKAVRCHSQFTEDENKRFSLMESFGVPMANLKQLIHMKGDERNKPGVQPGIPTDSTDNQLNEWVLQARYATKEVNNKEMRVSIKGDAKEEYPTVKKIIDILQKQNVNKFSLITSMEGAD